jgi:hypothetical protein
MDLVRLILLAVEDAPPEGPEELAVDGYDDEVVTHHLIIMGEAGLLEIDTVQTVDEINARPIRLTWAGHEFLESVRDDSQWRNAKMQTERAGGLVFEVLKAVASAAMLRQLGL